MKILSATLILMLVGCTSAPKATIEFRIDRFGVKYPVVNGVEYLPTDQERLIQRDLLVAEYCQ